VQGRLPAKKSRFVDFGFVITSCVIHFDMRNYTHDLGVKQLSVKQLAKC